MDIQAKIAQSDLKVSYTYATCMISRPSAIYIWGVGAQSEPLARLAGVSRAHKKSYNKVPEKMNGAVVATH